MKEARLIGVRLTLHTHEELLETIEGWVRQDSKQIVMSGNVHGFNLAHEIDWMRAMYERSGAVRLDGYGVILGARLLGEPAYPRFTGADFIWSLAEHCAQRGLTLYFLGAKKGVAARAAERLHARNPGLKILGTHHGYFDKRPHSAENGAVLAEINGLRPDILYVGFGMPLQERWLRDNWERLQCRVAITGGGVFDHAAGDIPRAPIWMRRSGLEWLGRLFIEPGKLWRRYLIGNPKYGMRLTKDLIRLVLGRTGRSP